MKRSRAFTLLEVMLAAALGTVVIIACLGVFSAIERADRRSSERLERTVGLATAQRTAERALRDLIMAPTANVAAVPGSARAPTGGAPPEALGEEGLPRMILEVDRSQDGVMVHRDGDGVDHPFSPQRLEIVVQSAPIYAEPTGAGIIEPTAFAGALMDERRARAADLARRRQARERSAAQPSGSDGQDASAEPGGENGDEREEPGGASERGAGRGSDGTAGNPEQPPADEGERSNDDEESQREAARAPGIRGVFETRFEPAERRRGMPPLTGPGGVPFSTEDRGTWSLWWRPLPLVTDEPEAAAPPPGAETPSLEKNTSPVMLASGLKMCRWEMVRNDETITELEATHWEELPAYVTLELETDVGQWHKWMFEVNGTRGPEPGTALEIIGGNTGQLDNPTVQPGRTPTPPSAGGRDRLAPRGTRSGTTSTPTPSSRTATPSSRTRPQSPGTRPQSPGGRPQSPGTSGRPAAPPSAVTPGGGRR